MKFWNWNYLWFLLPVVLGALEQLVGRLVEAHRFARAGLSDVREMSGQEFEKCLEHLFVRLGYRVERTPYQGDYGVDLILTDSRGQRTAVQAKRWKWKVGVKAVQQVVGGAAYYKCRQTLVVTTSRYTQQAVHMAQETGTQLWDLDDLGDAMSRATGAEPPAGWRAPVKVRRHVVGEARREARPAPKLGMPVPKAGPIEAAPTTSAVQAAEAARTVAMAQVAAAMQAPEQRPERREPGVPACPECGAAMVLSKRRGREMWACSRYPACKGYRLRER